MKTIVDTATNTSRYLFADDKAVDMGADVITVGDPSAPDFIIGDLNSGNASMIEGVIEPDDWYGCKYSHDGSAWALVEGWVDPRESE